MEKLSTPQPHFPETYEQLTAPDPIEVENDEQASAAIREYGKDLKAATELNYSVLDMFFVEQETALRTIFSLETMQVLGTVTKTPLEQGIRLTFEKKKLLPRTISIVRDIEVADQALFRSLEHLE